MVAHNVNNPAEQNAADDKKDSIIKVIESSIKQDVTLMVHEENVYSLAKFSRKCEPDEITRARVRGDIADSDFAILRAVCSLGQANTVSVCAYLKCMKRIAPERLIASTSMESVRARLMELSKLGCLFAQEIMLAEGGKTFVFSCTEMGVSLLRKVYGESLFYERFLNAENKCDMFRHVAGGYVSTSIASNVDVVSFKGVHYNKRFREENVEPYFYSLITAKTKDSELIDIVVFPLYFEFDKGLYTENERLSRYKDMLVKTEQWVRLNAERNGTKTRIAVCVENLIGMQKAVKLINECTPLLMDICYYTSDRVMYKSRGAETKAFFKTKMQGDRCSFVVKDIVG